MSTCQCGSQKQSKAPSTINTNDIGVVCGSLGVEGTLCRLLDLVPAAIKKLTKLDPNNSDKSETIIYDILKKVASKIANIALDSSGNIDVASFCQSEPPALPDPIGFDDVFVYIAELVPFLNHFFEFNDILSGNNSRLLDKIVKTWLYQKWFENCECKRCNDSPDPTTPPYQNPPFMPVCGVDSVYIEILNKRIVAANMGNAQSQSGADIENAGVRGTEIDRPNFIYEVNELDIGCIHVIERARNYLFNLTDAGLYLNYPIVITISTSTENCICPDSNIKPIKKKPPSAFCELFPDDPLCLEIYGPTDPTANNYNPDATVDDGSDTYDCNLIFVNVTEFVRCGATTRLTKSMALFDSGDAENIDISVFSGCDNPRTTSQMQLFNCKKIYGCTDPTATNYNPSATSDDGSCVYQTGCSIYQAEIEAFAIDRAQNGQKYTGTLVPYESGDLYLALQDLQRSDIYQAHPDCTSDFESYFSTKWHDYWFPPIYGCTDDGATNYNPDATVDDGSCVF